MLIRRVRGASSPCSAWRRPPQRSRGVNLSVNAPRTSQPPIELKFIRAIEALSNVYASTSLVYRVRSTVLGYVPVNPCLLGTSPITDKSKTGCVARNQGSQTDPGVPLLAQWPGSGLCDQACECLVRERCFSWYGSSFLFIL